MIKKGNHNGIKNYWEQICHKKYETSKLWHAAKVVFWGKIMDFITCSTKGKMVKINDLSIFQKLEGKKGRNQFKECIRKELGK